jgi:membrane protein DedA with SNARE-associated domain
MTLESLIEQYGYAAIFIGAILEGETALLIAAVLVQQGLMDFRGMLLASTLGAFTGDQFFFHLGRCKGNEVFRNYPGWQNKIRRAAHLLDKRRRLVMLGYRFLYGLRAVIPFLLGSGSCRVPSFVILSAISAIIWAVVIGTGGYFFGEAFERWLAQGRFFQKGLLLGIILIATAALIVRWRQSRADNIPDK